MGGRDLPQNGVRGSDTETPLAELVMELGRPEMKAATVPDSIVSTPRNKTLADTTLRSLRASSSSLQAKILGSGMCTNKIPAGERKHGYGILETHRLLLKRTRRCSRLFDERRILLRKPVHLVHCMIYFIDPTLCSSDATAISPTMPATCFIAILTSPITSPTASACLELPVSPPPTKRSVP